MHKIEKRQALESNKKDGYPNKEPVSQMAGISISDHKLYDNLIKCFVNHFQFDLNKEVANRIIPCPQDVLGQGGNNGGRYCNNCYCNERRCHYECRKCSNGNNGWGNGNHHNNRPGNNWSNGGNQGNNWSNSGHINCQRCNCRDGGCWNTCLKCHRNNNNNNHGNNWGNNNNYPSNSGSSWGNNRPGNSWGNQNGGWRNDNGVNGRLHEDSVESQDVKKGSNQKIGTGNAEDNVEFELNFA